MKPIASLCHLGAAVVCGVVILGGTATADIEKIMNQCDNKLCPFFRASITIPPG